MVVRMARRGSGSGKMTRTSISLPGALKRQMDAAVCAKWFLDEEYSENARRLRDSFVKGRLGIAVPSLLFYETLNALRYSKLYDERELGLAAESLSKYGFDVWSPKGEVYTETAHLSLGHDI